MYNNEIIDFKLTCERTNNDEALAKEMLDLLVKDLPQHKKEAEIAFKKKNFNDLTAAAHKVNGATCYLGTPRLSKAASNLEIRTKQEEPIKKIKEAYYKYIQAIDDVIKLYKQMGSRI
jgi:two-component system, NarL family, sensor histidine kinase BarA